MVQHENALTEDDIKSALEAYDREYYNFTISDIEAVSYTHLDWTFRVWERRKTGRCS